MKHIVLLLSAACLMFGACRAPEKTLDLPAPDSPGQELTRAIPEVPSLSNGSNYILFDYEFTSSPDDFVTEGYSNLRKWTGLEDNKDAGPYAKLLRIDDDAALRKHFRPDYGLVDWSQKTLLLAYGMRLYNEHPVVIRFDAQGGDKYLLTAEIKRSFACALMWWRVAILVDKLPAEAVIEVATPDYNPGIAS